MKKKYITPLAIEVEIETEQMLATSFEIVDDENERVDTSTGGQLSGGNRGEWGNLWK